MKKEEMWTREELWAGDKEFIKFETAEQINEQIRKAIKKEKQEVKDEPITKDM